MAEQALPTLDELADVAALGPEPSAEYLARVDALDNEVREAIHVSNGYQGIPSLSKKHFYASVLYTALITRSVSLAQLVPFSPWADKPVEHWDYSSASDGVRFTYSTSAQANLVSSAATRLLLSSATIQSNPRVPQAHRIS